MNAEDLNHPERWKATHRLIQHNIITLAPWHGTYVNEFQPVSGLSSTNGLDQEIQFQHTNLGANILKNYHVGSQNLRDNVLKRTPFLLRDSEEGSDYSIMLDIKQGRISTPAMMEFMKNQESGEELGLADAYYCEMIHAMQNLINGASGVFYGALIPSVCLSQTNLHNEAWLKSFLSDPIENNLRKYVPDTAGRGLEAILLRASEIIAHPNYNDAVITCAGNSQNMLEPHNWHLPAVIMAMRSFPIPCQAETLLDTKNYAALLMTYGDSFRNTDDNSLRVCAAEALSALSPSFDNRGKKMATDILKEGFHITLLWDILRLEPTDHLPENSVEDSIFRLSAGSPRPEGLYTNGEALLQSIKRFSEIVGFPVLSELTIIDKNYNVIHGTPDTDLQQMLRSAQCPHRAMTPEEASSHKFEINETHVDKYGIYIGPELHEFKGEIVVTVPCFYNPNNPTGDKKGLSCQGNLTLKDGKGGPYLHKKEEKGTIFTVDGSLSANNIISKSEEALGSNNFTLVCADQVSCDKVELCSGNLKTTKGGIKCTSIDAGVVISAAGILSENNVYARTIVINGKLKTGEVHTDWIQGQGDVQINQTLTLMYGSVLNGTIQADRITILNPHRGKEGNYKPTLVCRNIRTNKIEPSGIFMQVDSLENPSHALKGGQKNTVENRMLI